MARGPACAPRQSSGCERRSKSEQETDDAGNSQREDKRAPVDGNLRDAGQGGWAQPDEKLDAPGSGDRAERASEDGKHGGFGEPLRHQLSAGCAESAANRGFLLSGHSPCHQKIRDVDAGDQQHGRHGAQQDQGDGTKFAQKLFVKSDHFDAVAGVFTVRSGIRMLGFLDMPGGSAEGRLSGFERDAGLEAGDHPRGVTPTMARIERNGNPEVDGAGPQAELEVGGHDTDHPPAGLANADRLPDDCRIAAKPPDEKRMAQHHNRFRPAAIFLR